MPSRLYCRRTDRKAPLRSKTTPKCTRRAQAIASDAHWLNRSLWTGLVPHYGPVWTTLLGSPQELAEAFLAYKEIGVSEFIISGWPEVDEVDTFGQEVLPLDQRKAETAMGIETDMNLRFHWMLPKGGEVAMKTAQETSRVLTTKSTSPAALPDMEGWVKFARSAEESGIESVLLSFSRYEPDTILIACAVGRATTKLKFIVAYRMGLMQPTTFVQQINTLSGLIGGRVALNVVAGSSTAEQRGYGDFLEHDERYARAEEFLTICHSFWRNDGEVDFAGKYCRIERGKLHTPFLAPDRTAPEIYVSGHSEQAQRLALTRGSCWLRLIDTPEKLSPLVSRFREQGIEVCSPAVRNLQADA